MFKMGCSMARKILAPGSSTSTPTTNAEPGQEQANKQAGAANKRPAEQPQQQQLKAKIGDELNDFSKLEEDPRLPLNVRQIFKITKSWKAIARTMSKTGTAMFLNLFEQNQDLFYLFDRFQHLKGKELHESMELREHAATVMSTLDQSINLLSDYDNFVTYLHSIGKLHRKVPDFKREHFWKIEQPFLKAVKQTLDERCNETIEEIYKIAIKLIIETIADGYGQEDEQNEPRGADTGQRPQGSAGNMGGARGADPNNPSSKHSTTNSGTGSNTKCTSNQAGGSAAASSSSSARTNQRQEASSERQSSHAVKSDEETAGQASRRELTSANGIVQPSEKREQESGWVASEEEIRVDEDKATGWIGANNKQDDILKSSQVANGACELIDLATKLVERMQIGHKEPGCEATVVGSLRDSLFALAANEIKIASKLAGRIEDSWSRIQAGEQQRMFHNEAESCWRDCDSSQRVRVGAGGNEKVSGQQCDTLVGGLGEIAPVARCCPFASERSQKKTDEVTSERPGHQLDSLAVPNFEGKRPVAPAGGKKRQQQELVTNGCGATFQVVESNDIKFNELTSVSSKIKTIDERENLESSSSGLLLSRLLRSYGQGTRVASKGPPISGGQAGGDGRGCNEAPDDNGKVAASVACRLPRDSIRTIATGDNKRPAMQSNAASVLSFRGPSIGDTNIVAVEPLAAKSQRKNHLLKWPRASELLLFVGQRIKSGNLMRLEYKQRPTKARRKRRRRARSSEVMEDLSKFNKVAVEHNQGNNNDDHHHSSSEQNDRQTNLMKALHKGKQAANKLLADGTTSASDLGESIKMLILINKLILTLACSTTTRTTNKNENMDADSLLDKKSNFNGVKVAINSS